MLNFSRIIKNKDLRVTLAMIIGTLIYCFSVVFILDLGEFYAGGVTGVSQLLSRILQKLGVTVSKSIFIALFNIPLFVIGFRGVSKKFAYLSLGSILVQVISVYGFEVMRDKAGLDLFAKSLGDEKIILAIFGGLMCGIGSGISLRSGASTGGLDIISQYLSFKKNMSFTSVSLTIDAIIITLGGVVAGDVRIAVYTLIRLIIHILVLDRIHTVYNFMKIQVVSPKKEELRQELLARFNHGMTIYKAQGGYTGQDLYVIEIIVSSFEVADYKTVIKKIDQKAFISVAAVKEIDGNFNKNVIA
ncbi:MAG: YitT family protein [Acholeplasmataceae bacterium]|nr:YitT family protein [Acholeplasmataceae bacterium]